MQDFYDPKTLAGAIKKTIPLKIFLEIRFSDNVVIIFPVEAVTIEFQEGKRKLAPYVNARICSENIEREGYERKTFRMPSFPSATV